MYQVQQETLDNIKKEMKKVLVNYTGKTNEALDSILNAWLKGKKQLLDMFSKHQNWNPDKLMIQFDTDYSREFDSRAIFVFRSYLESNSSNRHGTVPWRLPSDEKQALSFLVDINSQFFDDTMTNAINALNSTNDNFKIRTNMKASKAVGKICGVLHWDEFPNYNREYAKFCDAINPIKVRRHTCISLNPIDYLLMSNGNSWSSCHSINYKRNGSGCFTSGTMSYLLDTSSFVFYTVDSSFNGDDIELEPKLQRQIFGYKQDVIFQSRLYPQNLDSGAGHVYTEIREVVQKVIADCTNKPNLWVLKKDSMPYVKRTTRATCYPDWNHSRGVTTVSVHKSVIEEAKQTKVILMGRQPICIRCGRKHSNSNSLFCPYCR